MELMIRTGRGRYRKATADEILAAGAPLAFRADVQGRELLTNPGLARSFVTRSLAGRSAEAFCALALDNRHRAIEWRELFQGTIDGASVHPREVVRWALATNAAAIILVHNHPSGVAEPSQADELITHRLRDALALVDIRVLDHLIAAGPHVTSLAERGVI